MLKQNYPLSQPSSSHIINSLTLSNIQQQLFKNCNTQAFKISELISGVKLAKVVNKIFYENSNAVLNNKIISQNQQRKGNNVINLNIILKQIKNNAKFSCPQIIKQLSPFKLIDNEQQMIKLIDWLVQCWTNQTTYGSAKNNNISKSIEQSKQNLSKNIGNFSKLEDVDYLIKNKKDANNKSALQVHQNQNKQMNDYQFEMQQYGKQQNLFQNVYFLDRDLSPPKQDVQLNDSLEMSEKVSKKGSFKVIKPKTKFEDNNKNQDYSNDKRITEIESPNKFSKQQQYHATVNKNNLNGTQNFQRYYSDEKQSPARKTIPKFPDRPPMYRKQNKQQTKTQMQNKISNLQQKFNGPQPFLIQNQYSQAKKSIQFQKQKQIRQKDKNESLINQISRIDQEIKRQSSQQLSKIRQSQTRVRSTTFSPQNKNNKTKSGRKLFKIDIKNVNQAQRKSIISWLIGINLLNSMATNYFDRFHQICKNGVIFPEIINHYKGRLGQIAYFKNPLKSAQIHSNYQKVFTCLKQLPNFQSQLLFMYDYFIPEVLQNAFWSLLKSCQHCFQKTALNKNNTYTRQSSIKQKLKSKQQPYIQSRIKTQACQNSLQNLKKNMKNNGDYQKIKFGSSNKFKSQDKKFNNQINKQNYSEKQSQKSKRKGSLDFIKQLPQKINNFKHEQLIQVQEPVEINKVNKGYKELHQLRKSHNSNSFVNTPQKKADISMSRSRIVSTNSIKKVQQKPQVPSITLQMQMKTIKYLKQKNFINFQTMIPLSLFEDPIRNGVLFNKIISEQIKVVYKFNHRPKNIIDCRQNFKTGLAQLKQSFVLIPFSYDFYIQEIIKGQLTIFYGLVWHILNFSSSKGIVNIGSNFLKNQSAILNISKNINYLDNQLNQKILSQILFWIRQLQQQNPLIAQQQIRDFQSLSTNIITNNLLYKIATAIVPQKYTLKPTYQHPLNQLEQQSNLKKILSFYTHNKILKSQLAWKSKSLVKKQKSAIIQVMKSLMSYSKNIKKPILHIQSQNPIVSFVKFARPNERQQIKGIQRNDRLQTTMANNSFAAVPVKKQGTRKGSKKQIQTEINYQIPWMRNIGFTGDLSLNNGVILCRLISRLTMQTLNFNQNPTSKAQCLTNIRKALKLIDKFKWDEEDIASADEKITLEIYKFIKQKYKHSYVLKEFN